MSRTPWCFVMGVVLLASGGCSANFAQATKDVQKTAAHVPGKGLAVLSENGSIQVLADPQRSDVEIRARVRAGGATGEEAAARVETIQIVVQRREDDGVLEAYAVWPDGRRGNEGCDFVIKIPSVDGVTAKTSNGGVTFQGLGGAGSAETSSGSVTITDHAGTAQVKTSNAKVKLTTIAGDVSVTTSNGGLEFDEIAGKVEAATSNASIRFVAAKTSKQPFKLTTSNGGVQVTTSPLLEGRIEAKTSNGKINVKGDREGISLNGKKQQDIVLTKDGPTSIIRTSNASVTITLE